MQKNTDDLRIKYLRPLISPAILLEELPISNPASQLITATRHQIAEIIHGKDDRLLVIVGPCSIHDPEAALEYARHLAHEINHYQNDLCIVMRVYFEKPRTIVGWKGLINDPKLNNSFEINLGLRVARKLLVDIAALQVPTGTEFLDTIIPQFISDLISWGAIGARTTESQIHRELASGLSMPIGFKNGTGGDIQIAIDAIRAAKHAHHFLSVTKQGITAIVGTAGNEDCHIILRGSNQGTNFDTDSINDVKKLLLQNQILTKIMVDCSHGNSHKDYTRQAMVVDSICNQISHGEASISGVMIESNLIAGKQALHAGKDLIYGQSITDGCVDWTETKLLLKQLAKAVRQRRSAS